MSAAVVAPEEAVLEAVLALDVVLATGGGEAWWFRLADVTCTMPNHCQIITHQLCLLSRQAHFHKRQCRMLFAPALQALISASYARGAYSNQRCSQLVQVGGVSKVGWPCRSTFEPSVYVG